MKCYTVCCKLQKQAVTEECSKVKSEQLYFVQILRRKMVTSVPQNCQKFMVCTDRITVVVNQRPNIYPDRNNGKEEIMAQLWEVVSQRDG